jgi:hypothetical protein
MKLIYESDNGVMLKTISSSGTYYLIKSATINKSFWNTGLSYANVFAKKESALKKLYTMLQRLPETAFYDEEDMYNIEDPDELKDVKFAEFYITDTHGKVIEDVSEEVKQHLLSDEKFVSGLFDDLDDEDFD